jgi:hypothetical protein
MSAEQLQALRTTIDYLDELMDESPSRELADISNYLEKIYQEHING